MTALDEQPAAYPSLKQSWALLGITLLVALGLNLALIFVGAIFTFLGQEGLSQSFLSHSLTLLFTYVIIFVMIIGFASSKKRKVEGEFSPNLSLPPFPVLVLTALATLGIYFIVDPLVDFIPMPDFIERLFLELLGEQDMWTVLTVVVAAPVLEELLLRGIILDGLLKIYSPKKAIIWSALFFGFFHLNPWQFIPAFALGLFMGWIYYRTRSLMTTIFIHFVANSAGVILGYFFLPEAQEMAPTRSFFPGDAYYFGLLAAALVILVFALQMLNKKLPSISASTNEPL